MINYSISILWLYGFLVYSYTLFDYFDLNIHSLLLSQYRGMIHFSVSKCHQREHASYSLIYNCHIPRGFIYLISLQNIGIKTKPRLI